LKNYGETVNPPRNDSKVVRSTCKGCHGGCGIVVTVQEGTVVHIEGDPDSLTKGTMCAKGLSAIQHIDHPDRLLFPLKRDGERGSGKWKRISWDEALGTIANKWQTIIAEDKPLGIMIGQGTGRGCNRYPYRLARSLGGSSRTSPGYFCLLPRIWMAEVTCTGQGRLYVDYHGWGGEFPKTQFVWPKQLEISNADGEMAVWFIESLKHAKNLVVIDPRPTALTDRATLWLRIRPGTDAALALGMLHVIIEEELYDKPFVDQWTHGFDALRERVKPYTPSYVSQITWLAQQDIVRAARMFAVDTPSTIQIGQAVEGHLNGCQTVRSFICLMAVTGNIERPGGMVNWIPATGTPIEDFGTDPDLRDDCKTGVIGEEVAKLLGHRSAAHPGTWINEMVAGTSKVRALHMQGGNPLQHMPNSSMVAEALRKLELISVADLFMSPMAQWADIVLPVAHALETDDIFNTHPRFFISAVNKAVEPPGEAWTDAKICNEIGKRVAPKWWFDTVEDLLDAQLMAKGANMKWKEFAKLGCIAKTGKDQIYYKYKTDYWRKGGGFPTPTGKVELFSTIFEKLGLDPLPDFVEPNESPLSTPELAREYPLILTTGGRRPFFFHSQYRQIPWLRSFQEWPFAEIHPETAASYGIKEGDWIWIETLRGRIKQRAHLVAGLDRRCMHAQHAWWYPERDRPYGGLLRASANVLASNELPGDPAMGAPSFRCMLCKISLAESDQEDDSAIWDRERRLF